MCFLFLCSLTERISLSTNVIFASHHLFSLAVLLAARASLAISFRVSPASGYWWLAFECHFGFYCTLPLRDDDDNVRLQTFCTISMCIDGLYALFTVHGIEYEITHQQNIYLTVFRYSLRAHSMEQPSIEHTEATFIKYWTQKYRLFCFAFSPFFHCSALQFICMRKRVIP